MSNNIFTSLRHYFICSHKSNNEKDMTDSEKIEIRSDKSRIRLYLDDESNLQIKITIPVYTIQHCKICKYHQEVTSERIRKSREIHKENIPVTLSQLLEFIKFTRLCYNIILPIVVDIKSVRIYNDWEQRLQQNLDETLYRELMNLIE